MRNISKTYSRHFKTYPQHIHNRFKTCNTATCSCLNDNLCDLRSLLNHRAMVDLCMGVAAESFDTKVHQSAALFSFEVWKKLKDIKCAGPTISYYPSLQWKHLVSKKDLSKLVSALKSENSLNMPKQPKNAETKTCSLNTSIDLMSYCLHNGLCHGELDLTRTNELAEQLE